jgi:hypothetical protein
MKLILALISLAAIFSMLVPPSVLGQGDFRIFVTDDDAIHELELTATEGQNGQVNQVSGFAIEPNSVVQINQNENLQVFTSTNEPERVEKVKLTDHNGQLIELSKVGNGWSLQGFDDGVYLLDVIVNTPNGQRGAFETVLVILAPNAQEANPTQVINQVFKTDTKIVFKEQPKQQPKPRPLGNPYCDLVPDDYKGTCHDRLDYDEETGLYPCRDGSNVKDWRDCKDAGKHPDERMPGLPRPGPEPIDCPAGQQLSSDGLSCAPPCDGSYQDCIYNGHFCRAGSTEHACELPLEEVEAQTCGALITLGCPLGLGLPGPQTCATGWHLDERNVCQPDDPVNPALGFAALPPSQPLGFGNAPPTPGGFEGEEPGLSCQPEDDFCEPGCESPSMDCIDDVNLGDDGVDSVPDEVETEDVEEEPEGEEEDEPEEEESEPEEDEAAADEDAFFG